jgi:signal transduction histidine kinase
MESSVQKRNFDAYFTTNEPGKRTGFGLTIVHGIVKSYVGAIKVSIEAGNGTTFTVFLPRAIIRQRRKELCQ